MSNSPEVAEARTHPFAVTADDIDAAARRISDVVASTPLQYCERLSAVTGAHVYLKREDLQIVRSYKIRGAYNLMAQLTPEELTVGVVTASAGNHAQGVAFACRAMQVQGRIYVPANTPKQKRDRIRVHGGEFVELIVTGDTFDAAAASAAEDVVRTGATMVPPFDDPRTVAGQGTIAAEIVEQLGAAPDTVVMPVGGGGCIAGISTYLRERSPSTALVGVEPSGAASMTAALVAGGPVTLSNIDPFVDGAAVRRIGDVPYEALRFLGAEVVSHASLPLVTVPTFPRTENASGPFLMTQIDEGAICTAMLDLYQNEGVIAEPAGALSVAALNQISVAPGSTVVCLVSGGNNDVSRYGEILERSLVHLGLKHYFLVDFPQEPGALRRFLDEVLGPDDDITLFEYVKRNNRETGAALVGVELGHASGLSSLLERMRSSRLRVEQLEPGSPAYSYLT
ncbi:threonine ammonia-lyase IlvA [Rhodococcus sp. BP-252]|uniref:threonine ammonia-lyase IlvA n=1 Tax=unclassified Rhodococcus (in: high G+C Gram-positive bacteria) TaxID=192944 RepID=UPI001C9AE5E4|nr:MULTISPECIES: threonine ammonia-lyase IlvA [unclassified Rhodococcus (in: high G+C Gram-positive bacteria)]MBY6411329.1 threonine ammonia-lyase IlvA [Rhodococcus sp. BP-320]MBY6415988.1 threonine ammonia-lyase IlvA [Rhodococcus sp. BP-321]MBY6420503.1 threonine ammonia-lyase IlvA [Rhodococcus sp. BP-324]MBY6426195.1 threonine ammonia-lyase IlvA [Rhodococcus sp. BP-323]MBY6431264.1 threonine ammonia-lyase IlvA [Rhodococcus sp. BP-322]